MRASSMEFGELNVEYGYAYRSDAVVEDGSEPPVSADDVRIYEPSTRPGAALRTPGSTMRMAVAVRSRTS